MKKLCLIMLLAATVVGCNQKEQPKNTILGLGTPYIFANEFMEGQVKVVKEILYWAKNENGQIKKGDLIIWKELDSLGFSHNFTASFDENGQIVGCNYFDEKGKVINRWKGMFENGILIKASIFSHDTNTFTVKYKYNELGWLTETSYLNPGNDTLLSKWAFGNDDKGLYFKIEYFNFKDEFRGRNLLSRNEIGRIIKREYFNRNDSITYYENLTYNDRNILESQERFSRGISNVKWSYAYTYDTKGNWITAICSKDGKPMIFGERSYTYY